MSLILWQQQVFQDLEFDSKELLVGCYCLRFDSHAFASSSFVVQDDLTG